MGCPESQENKENDESLLGQGHGFALETGTGESFFSDVFDLPVPDPGLRLVDYFVVGKTTDIGVVAI